MCDSSDDSETLSDTGMIFTEEAMKAISMEGKSDCQLLELIYGKLNCITSELQQVIMKQDQILKHMKMVERKVHVHDKYIQLLSDLKGKNQRVPFRHKNSAF